METKPPDVTWTEWIEINQTSAGGWKKDFLESIGVGWPPPKGWRKEIEKRDKNQGTEER